MKTTSQPSKQVTGNVGMFFACYQLSRLGLNVMPTSRNAKGADVIAYTSDQTKFLTFQIKAMTKLTNIALGKSLDDIDCDWWIVVAHAYDDPAAYILNKEEIKASARIYDGKYWAQGAQLSTDVSRNGWNRITECLAADKISARQPPIEFTKISRIKRWAGQPSQVNHKIIRAFLDLEKEGKVSRDVFRNHCETVLAVANFDANYSSMKTDHGNSHGMVFDDDKIYVWMWPQVRAEVDRHFSR